MPEAADRREIEDRLFAYAAGELDAVSRARVEEQVRADPGLRARLAWYEAVCDGVADALPSLEGLPSADEVIARVRGKRRKPGLFGWLAGPALKPAAALAAVLIVGQGAIIAMLATERGETELVRSAAPTDHMILVVAFNPGATESSIRSLLLEAGARIVDGPKQLGEYRLEAPANRAQFAKSLFEQSKLVEYVRVEKR